MSTNPYAAPASDPSAPPLPDMGFQVVGDRLLVRDGTQLPDVCLLSGATTGEFSRRRKKFRAYTAWHYLGLLLIPIHLFLALVVTAIWGRLSRRQARIDFVLLKKHTRPRPHILILFALCILSLLGAFGTIFLTVTSSSSHGDLAGYVIIGLGTTGVILALIIPFLAKRLIPSAGRGKNEIFLKKVAPEALSKLRRLQNSAPSPPTSAPSAQNSPDSPPPGAPESAD
ncbi:MAG: hypothetical protein ACQKBY_00565 [Verrucomicrobiales bacterium]